MALRVRDEAFIEDILSAQTEKIMNDIEIDLENGNVEEIILFYLR